MWDTEEQQPAGLGDYTDWVGDDMTLAAFAVYEKEVAIEWYVFALALNQNTRGLDTFTWRLLVKDHPEYPLDAPVEYKMCVKVDPEMGDAIKLMSEDDQSIIDTIMYLPVAMAQVVNVLGVRYDEQFIWRPARRRFQRKFGVEHPKIVLHQPWRIG